MITANLSQDSKDASESAPGHSLHPLQQKIGRIPDAIFVVLIGIVCAMHVGKLPVTIPVLQEQMGLTLIQAGWLLSTVQAAGMVLGLCIGLLADRHGPRQVMLLGLVILSLSSFVGAASPSIAQLLFSRLGEGLGFLLSVLPAPALIRQVETDSRNLMRSMGLWGTYMPAGVALAMLIGGWFVNTLDWHFYWLLLGSMTALCAVFLQWLIPPGQPAHQSTGYFDRVKLTLSSPGPWLVAVSFLLYSGQWLAVVGFLPTIYRDAGLQPWAVGALSSFAVGINVIGSICAGRVAARLSFPAYAMVPGFVGMGLGALLAFGLIGHPALQYVGVLVFSIFGGLVAGTLFGLCVILAPSRETVSTTVGWMQQMNSVGQFSGPPALAALALWAGGWQYTWIATGICSALGVVLAIFLIAMARRARVASCKAAPVEEADTTAREFEAAHPFEENTPMTTTNLTITVELTDADLSMVRAFAAWNKDYPKTSPKKHEIHYGYAEHRFLRHEAGNENGPNTFKRLVTLGVIKHSRNGHCWLTRAGNDLAEQLVA
ncbi:MFS transporter [Hydrogenophaga sp. NFH-34]|uniref:MFS transporter n=1 Tax=Hydrogenophaga sp. NFH-34 TaxID=2744446 RepID=UPI001F25D330|nr:MFS transporter [Hydrogenophaga sp. NFH-34]